jgi:DNA-binding response OmpR family regulator
MTHAPTRAPHSPTFGAGLARRGDAPPAGRLSAAAEPAGPPRGHRGSTAHRSTEGVLVDDGLRVCLEERTTSVGIRTLDLTFLEFELLAYLLLHPKQVFTRRQLMETVWGYPEAGGGRTVDVHIARLRRKLGARHRYRLATVRRVGYKYVPHDLTHHPVRLPGPRTAF